MAGANPFAKNCLPFGPGQTFAPALAVAGFNYWPTVWNAAEQNLAAYKFTGRAASYFPAIWDSYKKKIAVNKDKVFVFFSDFEGKDPTGKFPHEKQRVAYSFSGYDCDALITNLHQFKSFTFSHLVGPIEFKLEDSPDARMPELVTFALCFNLMLYQDTMHFFDTLPEQGRVQAVPFMTHVAALGPEVKEDNQPHLHHYRTLLVGGISGGFVEGLHRDPALGQHMAKFSDQIDVADKDARVANYTSAGIQTQKDQKDGKHDYDGICAENIIFSVMYQGLQTADGKPKELPKLKTSFGGGFAIPLQETAKGTEFKQQLAELRGEFNALITYAEAQAKAGRSIANVDVQGRQPEVQVPPENMMKAITQWATDGHAPQDGTVMQHLNAMSQKFDALKGIVLSQVRNPCESWCVKHTRDLLKKVDVGTPGTTTYSPAELYFSKEFWQGRLGRSY